MAHAQHHRRRPLGTRLALARVVEAEGTVLLLGAPLDTVTLVHHAERIAATEPKRWVSYEMPIHTDAGTRWHQFHAIDTSRGAYDYDKVTPNTDYIEAIAQSALNAGIGQRAVIFGASCHMFPARPLVQHATNWIEKRFGVQQSPAARP
jgi:aminoglycoside 3-N-acetyltransferase